MSETTRAVLSSWTIEFWPLLLSLLVIVVYVRGWRGAHSTMPRHFPRWRASCFICGIAVCWLAIASPLDALGPLLLQAHMVQHVLLMMVAPPLLLLGAPGIPLLRGLPATIRREWIGPFLAARSIRMCMHLLTHPFCALPLFIAATWIWHLPALYELALQDGLWHEIEHAFFLSTSLLFWWPVIQPWPSRPILPRWMMIPYLLIADLQNTMFSAIFVFLETPIYGRYGVGILGIETLDDQAAAGAIMWFAGSAAFLIPVAWIIKSLLQPKLAIAGFTGGSPTLPLPILEPAHTDRHPASRKDLLRYRFAGWILRSLRVRRTVQWIMLLLAAAIVADGLLGPRLSPLNLAGVLPWTHWRGLVVIAILLIGNAFCWSCPFMLPRELAKRIFSPVRRWPRFLRSKWIAASLLLIYLWAYEVFSLWDSPWWTAWVLIGYFTAAFVIDAFFRGAAFCRWVCPIGQFHFIESMISPREVARIDTETCRKCETDDCIQGGPRGRGCELDLYLPTKVGNLDCTWCMDCVRACPHDNVGVLARAYTADVTESGWRSGIGRIARRADIAALAALLTFGAFANALGMVGPILEFEDGFAASMGWTTPMVPATFVLLLVAVIFPAITIPSLAAWVRRTGLISESLGALACRLTLTLVPIGFSMWLVHMLFHFLTGIGTIIPTTQRALGDVGIAAGEPAWILACCLNVPAWLLPLELLLLDAGVVVSIIAAHRVIKSVATKRVMSATVIASLLPIALFLIGTWIVLQPMQMRGTILP
ncbi:MAG: cytochrome c oxidase assembly protein [Phycisphaerales bacterium]|nr:cytochrome c oxidase assembly protein [Phycisphaerales bacterium]